MFVQKNGKEEIRLIDWEYAGMQDPHVDIAMFCIYSLYNKRQVDRLIAAYFTDGCDDATRIKIYCYIAACGLLWSNWCGISGIWAWNLASIPCGSIATQKTTTESFRTS